MVYRSHLRIRFLKPTAGFARRGCKIEKPNFLREPVYSDAGNATSESHTMLVDREGGYFAGYADDGGTFLVRDLNYSKYDFNYAVPSGNWNHLESN